MITTEAWVLYQGPVGRNEKQEPAELRKEPFSFSEIDETEVLAEPIYGGWEANLTHALERRPVDICRQRGEEKIVLGNSGVVRILQTGKQVTHVKEGDYCLLHADAVTDRYGYTVKVHAYDAPHTIGLLAKRTKIPARNMLPIPPDTKHTLQQWSCFARYFTAWSNWHVAYKCLRSQLWEEECPAPFVWGWGGGVSLAELQLAQFSGCRTAMIASSHDRLALLERKGIQPINRHDFCDLNFDEKKFNTDLLYRARYLSAERMFLATVQEKTAGEGVLIFIDNIGSPVYRATLKALARQGIITTCGWKHGMVLSYLRAVECIERHIHIHTHGGRYSEDIVAMRFAEEHNWIPQPQEYMVYDWETIPLLAKEYAEEKIASYFPLFRIHAE